jgi:hypothetical protein
MKRTVMLALAALSMGSAAMAAQPDRQWSVVDNSPGSVLLVSEDPGSGNVVRVAVLTVYAKTQNGADSTFAFWTIDCATEMVLDEGATRYLGSQDVGKSQSVTPGGPRRAALGTAEKAVTDFICIGPLANADSTPLPTTDRAIEHAKELLALWH